MSPTEQPWTIKRLLGLADIGLVTADDDGLQHSAGLDGQGQFLDRVVIESEPRLKWIRRDIPDRELIDAARGQRGGSRLDPQTTRSGAIRHQGRQLRSGAIDVSDTSLQAIENHVTGGMQGLSIDFYHGTGGGRERPVRSNDWHPHDGTRNTTPVLGLRRMSSAQGKTCQ